MRTAASLLLVMLPMCIVLLSFHLVGQSWSLRLHRYELQSRALIAQALVTVMAQIGLIPLLGATAYTLVLGYLAGYIALMVVYLPVIRNPIVLYLQKHHSHQGLLEAARSYLRFPLYAGPYAVLGQVSVRVVVLALAALSTAGIVGQYAVAQRVTFLPVMALMGAASQVFYSRAARRLDDPRMPHMVRTVLVVGPMVVGPFFVLLILFGEPLFAIVFGPAWRQAGHFAAILAVPSLVKTLTAWLDRTFDIRNRQGLSLMLEVVYLVIVCVSTYAALRIWKDPELAIVFYAGVTVVYLLVWMICALVVAGFPSRLAFQFIVVTASVIAFMLGIDSLVTWVGASEPIRFACALLLALLLAAAGLWLGKERMRSMEQLAR
jgi:O-antigen/teichoic acid export membrane protein